LKAEEGVGTEGEEGATGVHGYACLDHQIFASLRVGGVEGVYDVVAVVVEGGCTAGWDAAAAAAVVGNTAVLAVGVVDHTDSEQQELAGVELAQVGEHMAAQILQRPEADKECMVGLQGVAVAVVGAETAPVVRVAVVVVVAAVAVAVAAAVAAAAVAIGSLVNHHNRNLRTRQIAPVEDAVVRVQAVGPGHLATVGCTLAALEADLLLLL
jgi:hypothetical protein